MPRPDLTRARGQSIPGEGGAGGRPEPLERIRQWLTGRLEAALGWLLYILLRKKIVLVVSSIRSGSTLLKALLAEAPDVSNLPEYNFQAGSEDRYRWYFRAHRLSPHPILVLKRPCALAEGRNSPVRYPALPDLDVSVIVLVRRPEATIHSISWMLAETGRAEPEYGHAELLDYWCVVYEGIVRALRRHPRVRFLHYEDLVRDPREVTRELFAWIGSVRREGTESYRRPESHEWRWGSDDGGPTIRSLRVQAPETQAADPELEARVAASERAQLLMRQIQAFGGASER